MLVKTWTVIAVLVWGVVGPGSLPAFADKESVADIERSGYGPKLEFEAVVDPALRCLTARVEVEMEVSDQIEVVAGYRSDGADVIVDRISVTQSGTYVFDVTQAVRSAIADGRDIQDCFVAGLGPAAKSSARYEPTRGGRGAVLVSYGARRSTEAANADEHETHDERPDRNVVTNGSTFEVTAHPNPFNPQTEFSISLTRPGSVALMVYDLRGALVRELFQGAMGIETRSFVWDGCDMTGRRVSSGVYFYSVTVDGVTRTDKVVMLK